MKIVVYDEKNFAENTKTNLENIAAKHSIEVEVEYFSNPEDCFNYFVENQADLFVAEIDMPAEKGTDLAKRLRAKLNNRFVIIFLTTSNDYAAESYEVGACNYLLKPCDNIKLEKALIKCRLFDRVNYIYLADGKDSIKFEWQKIIAVEACGKQCLVYTTKEKYTIHNQINKIAAIMPTEVFWQVHRSYLINIRHITALKGYDFIMDNNLAVPIRRSKFSEIKKAYLNL